MMHSIKGGWVGQTFALAKRNESEGRKSRIRRSKEERKAMVESFIKKYQESNNGNFPSLNLTHKEVGGSFYTVREIVRDIIQENRVLGPAKFNLEELTSDQFLEQNPLGSIARDPQAYVSASSIENHLESNKSRDKNEETLSVSDGNYTGAEHQMFDKGHIINGSQVDVINKESFEATSPELQVSEPLAPKENVEQELATTTTPTVKGDVINKESFETTSPELKASEHLTPRQNVEQELATTSRPLVKVDVINKESFETTGPDLQVSEHLAPKQNVEPELATTTTPMVKAGAINKEYFETTSPELQISEPLAPKQNVKQELATTRTPMVKVNPFTEDLIVETFPLRPVAGTAHRIEEGFVESRDSSKSPEKDVKMLELEQPKESSDLNGKEPRKNSNSSDEKFVDDLNGAHDKGKNLGGTLAESTNHSTPPEHLGHGFEDCTDSQVGVPRQNTITSETFNQSQLIDGAKTSIQDGFQTKNLPKTEGSKTSEEGQENANKHRVEEQRGGDSKGISNSTVDRINLDSWEGTPKKSVKEGPNPLISIFKALVEAFVKFWSE